MTEQLANPLLGLNFFVRRFVTPQLPFLRTEALDRPYEPARSAICLEIISWLGLGTKVGFFPRTEAFGLYERLVSEVFPKTAQNWELLSGVLPERERDFKALKGGDPEVVLLGGKEDFAGGQHSDLVILFRSCLLLASDLVSDARVLSYNLALNFMPPIPWEARILEAEFDPEQVALTQSLRRSDTLPIVPESVCAGLFRVLDSLDFFKSLFEDREKETSVPEQFDQLRSTTGALLQWRICVRDRSGRFTELVERVNFLINREIQEKRPSEAQRIDIFRSVAYSLKSYLWGDDEPKVMAAGSTRWG
jgi:hypothetical protein